MLVPVSTFSYNPFKRYEEIQSSGIGLNIHKYANIDILINDKQARKKNKYRRLKRKCS